MVITTRLVCMVPLLLAVAACESDAKKLERLRTDEATACLPVFAADSAAQARKDALARLQDKSDYGDLTAMQADIAEAKRALAADSAEYARSKAHPEQVAAEAKAMEAQRIKCDLATRALNIFMAGR